MEASQQGNGIQSGSQFSQWQNTFKAVGLLVNVASTTVSNGLKVLSARKTQVLHAPAIVRCIVPAKGVEFAADHDHTLVDKR